MKINISKNFLEKIENSETNNYVIDKEVSRKQVIKSLSLTLFTTIFLGSIILPIGLKKTYNNIVKENSIIYAVQIEENDKRIQEYAEEIKKLNLDDIQIIMKVMNDIWKEIEGYGKADDLPIGYYRLSFQEEGKGVCTSFSDEFTARMNAINPEYNARNIIVNLNSNEVGNMKICDIDQKIIDQTVNDNNNENNNIQSVDDKLFGNHMVSLIDIPNKDLTLMIDTTNLLIGVFKNGNIYVLNNKSYDLISYCYLINELCSPFESENDIYSIFDNDINNEILQEVSEEYGVEEQEKALQYVKSLDINDF